MKGIMRNPASPASPVKTARVSLRPTRPSITPVTRLAGTSTAIRRKVLRKISPGRRPVLRESE